MRSCVSRRGVSGGSRSILALAVHFTCVSASLLAASGARAETWTATTAGALPWSDPANWQGGTAPASSSSTIVDFYADTTTGPSIGTTVTSVQDLSDPFNLNVLNLRGTTTGGPGVEGVIAITNRSVDSTADYTKALVFSGANNQINILAGYGTGAGTTYKLRAPMAFQTDTAITLSNTGGNVQFNNYFGAGSGRLTLTNNAPTRTLQFNGDSVNNAAVLYTGNIVLTKGVAELGKRHSILGANSATTQTFTIDAGAQVWLNYAEGGYTQGQNFVLNGAANAADGAVGTAALRITGLSYGNGAVGGLAMASNSTVSVNRFVGGLGNPSARSVLVNQPVVGTGNLTVAGDGLLALTKATAAVTWDGVAYGAYSGNAYVSTGAGLQLPNLHGVLGANGGASAIGGQAVTVAPGASIIFNDGNGSYQSYQNFVLNGGGGYLTNANMQLNSVAFGSHQIGRLALAAGDSTMSVNRGANGTVFHGMNVVGAVVGTGNLVKSGLGPLNVNVASTATMIDGVSYPAYSGNVTVSQGWLQYGKADNILGLNGTVAAPGTQTVTVNPGASVRFQAQNAAYIYNQNFVVSGTGYTQTIGTTTTSFAALLFEDQNGFGGTGSSIGGLALPADANMVINRNAAASAITGVTVNGVISGSGALTKSGAGPLYLNKTSTARTLAGATYAEYSGNINVNAGWLQLGAADSILGPNGTLATPGAQTVTVANGAAVLFNNNNNAYLANQNFVLNGTGHSVTIGTTTTSYAALQVNNLNLGDQRVGRLGAATDTTISINLNATPDQAGRGLSTAGLAGMGVLTLNGNGTLYVRGPAAAIGATPAFAGIVSASSASLVANDADAFGTGGLAIGNGSATLASGLTKAVTLSSLSITGAGQLQLNDDTVVLKYSGLSPIESIRTTLASATPGIITSVTQSNPSVGVGYGQASALGVANTVYRGVSIGDDALIIRRALGGDATLDDAVNFDDLLKLAQNYGSSGAYWTSGDFNYDGSVNFDDLLKLAQNYNNSLLGEAVPSSIAADWALARSLVPEPTAALVVSAAAFVSGRRRR